LIEGWNLFSVSLGTKIIILKSIGGQIILNSHWFLKDEEAMDWKGGFLELPWDKENKLKEGFGKVWGKRIFGFPFLV
jgi:hypothetical protein